MMDRIKASKEIAEICSLGHQVQYFIDIVWMMMIPDIFRNGLKCKFLQNPSLLDMLVRTNGSTIVLTSSKFGNWGCGLDPDSHFLQYRKKWKGQNLMGELLTEVRCDLTGQY
jgi:ribA/ribD-fused uncharacterized protein